MILLQNAEEAAGTLNTLDDFYHVANGSLLSDHGAGWDESLRSITAGIYG